MTTPMLTASRTSNGFAIDDEVLRMIDAAGPILRRTSAASEANCRLAPEAMDALIEANILRAFVPKAYGGAEIGAARGVSLFMELAACDSAAAWVGAISAAGAWLTVLLPPQAAEEMLADPRSVINGSLFPPLAAEAVPGGYRVSGRTSFSSGIHSASWLGCQAVVMEHGAPKIGPHGMPVSLIVHFPASEAEIVPNWDTLGMRGTGSHDYLVHDVFVPDHRVWMIQRFAPVNPAFTDSQSRLGIWWFSALVASVGLGIARAAVDDFIALAHTKTPSYTQTSLADKPVVQDAIARARAAIDAARAYLVQSLTAAETYLETHQRLEIEQGIPIALAASHATEAAIRAVDLVHQCAGTTAIRNDQPFQRSFRDVHTVSQHAFASLSRFESTGKLLLGRQSDWPFHHL